MVRTLTVLMIASLSLGSALVGACGEAEESVATPRLTPTPLPITVSADRQDLVFRYLDPSKTAVKTATKVEDIPAASRAEVVVFVSKGGAPAGWEHVADLRAPLPVQTTPRQGFALRPQVAKTAPAVKTASAPSATATKGAVTMFSTQGCPYCDKARDFFESNDVSFSEFDLESDASARGKLQSLAANARVPASQLVGVPIIFVGRQVVRGFDKGRLKQLLGI